MSEKEKTMAICVSPMLWRMLKGVSLTTGSGDIEGKSPVGSMLCLNGLGAATGEETWPDEKGLLTGAEVKGLALAGETAGDEELAEVKGLVEGWEAGVVVPSPNSVLNLSRMSPVTPPCKNSFLSLLMSRLTWATFSLKGGGSRSGRPAWGS